MHYAMVTCEVKAFQNYFSLRRREIAQRIFKYSDIQYISLTPDKKLNSLIYRTLLYVNIYGSYKPSKQSLFLAHPVNVCAIN